MKKKFLALGVCASMLAVAVVGGTMAYFTDNDQAENVFTVGNIDIDLHEYKEDGTTPFEEIENIMPGMTYGKVVNVENIGKNDAYVRVTVVIPENMTPVWNTGTEWIAAGTNPAEGSGTYVFTLNSPLEDGKTSSAILKAVKLNENVTELNAKDTYEVLVSAEAIQSDSFDTAEAAYAALDANDGKVAAKVSVTNVDELNTELGTAQFVQMSNSIDSGKDIDMAAGAILDGKGYQLKKTSDIEPSVNAGVKTLGGTIKNITVTGTSVLDGAETRGFRAVYATGGISTDLVIEDATLSGTYALNITGASENYTLTVKDSTLNGWTSYAPLAGAKFDNVTFGTAEGFHNLKPQADTVLNECTFKSPSATEKFMIDAGATVTITFNKCKVDSTTITAANFAELFQVEQEIKDYNCTIVVDGETVAF